MTNLNATQTSPTELQKQIESLNSDIYDNLTLHSSNLDMLRKMVNTAIDDLSNENAPYFAMSQAKKALFIAQYLIDEFDYSLQHDIEQHPLYKLEDRA